MNSDIIQTIQTKTQEFQIYRKLIGKGAFSKIYYGKNTKTKEIVAAKCCKSGKFDETVLTREITILQTLSHINIIHLHDVYYHPQTSESWFLLEFCLYGDLYQLIYGTPLKEKYHQYFFSQIANAVCYLRRNHIYHRDIKPQNMLITNHYLVKLTDFGFSQYDTENLNDVLCGSPLYMAPELFIQNRYEDTSDLWSLGVILFMMITGNHLFSSKNMKELIQEHHTFSIDRHIVKRLRTPYSLSYQCKQLLLSLLHPNCYQRISWYDLQKHSWIQSNFQLTESLKLFCNLQQDKQETLPIQELLTRVKQTELEDFQIITLENLPMISSLQNQHTIQKKQPVSKVTQIIEAMTSRWNQWFS